MRTKRLVIAVLALGGAGILAVGISHAHSRSAPSPHGVVALKRIVETAMDVSASVVVPTVVNDEVEPAYERLHRAGLRVGIHRRLTLPFDSSAYVVRQIPKASQRVRRGTVVSIELAIPPISVGSPAVPTEIKRFTVPEFIGKPISTAVAWTEKAQLPWEARLPSLVAGNGSTLLDNYLVARQTPASGATLSAPSTLTLRGTQRRR